MTIFQHTDPTVAQEFRATGQQLDQMRGATAPIGTAVLNLSELTPPGWLKCDGSGYDVTQYPALYRVLGTATLPTLTVSGYSFIVRAQ